MILFALVRFRLEQEPDLGWHLAQGRLLAQGHWMRTNALGWTALDEPWVDTSWLFDLSAYASTRLFPELLGPKLLIAIFFAATLFFIGLASLELSPIGPWILPGVALLLLPKSTPRPHVATWAALAAVMWLCLRAHRIDEESSLFASQRSARRWRLLALLPIWMGAWFHPGAAFALAPLGLFCFEASLRTRAASALLPALLAPIALVANPSGPASVIHVFRHWNLSQVMLIQEFQRWTWNNEPALPFVVAIALLGLLLRSAQPTDQIEQPRWLRFFSQPAFLITVLVFAGLAFRTQRITYELFVVSAPALALFFARLRVGQGKRAAALALLCTTLLCVFPHHLRELLTEPQFAPRWNQAELPVRAATFLNEQWIDGNGFNGMRDGGYLAWARPNSRVFIDARIHAYPASFWLAFQRAETSSSAFEQFLRTEHAEWALATRRRERMGGWRLLDNQPGWALIYWDELNALFIRRDVQRFSALLKSFEYKRFHPWGNPLAELAQADPAMRQEFDREVARFLKTSPGDGMALLLDCASAREQEAPDVERRCQAADRAASEAIDPRLQMLLQKVETK